jgi:hypothetical protein
MPILTGGKVIEGSRPHFHGNPLGGGFGGLGPFSSPGLPAGGFLNNIAPPGAIVIRTDTGDAYENTGTLAATVWTARGVV